MIANVPTHGNQLQGVECTLLTSRGAKAVSVLYGASRPHTECFITHTAHIVHAITLFFICKAQNCAVLQR